MEKNSRGIQVVALVIALALATLPSCAASSTARLESESVSSAGTVEQAQSVISNEAAGSQQNVNLYTYQTHLFERLGLPGPCFVFEYPDGWRVTQEECRPQVFFELVSLTSDEGHTITFAFGNAIASTSGRTTDVLGEIDFNSDVYSDLQLPESASEYMKRNQTDEEIRDLKLQVRGWEREEQLGAGRGFYVTDSAGNDPYYYGYFQFMCIGAASRGTDQFSADEEREILQILSSLRQRPAAYDGELAAELVRAYQTVPGSYGYSEDGGDGHIFIDIWDIQADGAASNRGRMAKWDYTWCFTGERDFLGRLIVRFEPQLGNPIENGKELAYDESLGALCELDSPEPIYTR